MTWRHEWTKDVTARGVPGRPEWMRRFKEE
jgi:hypothetical protein